MPLVLLDIADGVATITLNNPDERNTMTAPMVSEIVAAMDRIEADENIGAIVVTGTAPAFCAGANLGNLAEADGESLGVIYEGFLRIARSPLPTIAVVAMFVLLRDAQSLIPDSYNWEFTLVVATHGCCEGSLARKLRWLRCCLVRFWMGQKPSVSGLPTSA
jgi:hypothetical protein